MNDNRQLNKSSAKYDWIVLDLDGTLIRTHHRNKGEGIALNLLDFDQETATIWVHKRPGFDQFLQQCFNHSQVGVWSMGQPNYVEAVVKLFPQPPAFVYNWCDCDRVQGQVFKDLIKIPDGSLMIDDDQSVLRTGDNMVDIQIVSRWRVTNRQDRTLWQLSQHLFSS